MAACVFKRSHSGIDVLEASIFFNFAIWLSEPAAGFFAPAKVADWRAGSLTAPVNFRFEPLGELMIAAILMPFWSNEYPEARAIRESLELVYFEVISEPLQPPGARLLNQVGIATVGEDFDRRSGMD